MKKTNVSNNMEQKLNELLAKDLGARLPYGVKCMISDDKEFPQDKTIVEELTPSGYKAFIDTINCSAVKPFFVKPYLRPMSSMTQDEFQELRSICPHATFNKTNEPGWIIGIYGSEYGRISRIDEIIKLIDWLNAHHFDYRGLIPMNLALVAPEGMYK